MITITCDTCQAERPPKESVEAAREPEWIQGYDLQSETALSVQRSIRFLPRWDDRRALEFGSIHFCSEECRDRYIKGRAAA